MEGVARDPRFKFSQGDKGREEIKAYIQERLAKIRTVLPRAFNTMVPGHLEVKRMSPEQEPGAPAAYGGDGSIDGKIPGKFWINLRSTDLHSKYSLPDLAAHEAIPGHVWQGEYANKLPLIRTLLAFNAYSEGWALYAEQLVDELGIYDGEPALRLGYLQSIAFRCCRLVVDTGLHAKRWTRDRKSTRLNSSHTVISYAVFCLKKKKSTLRLSRPAPNGWHELIQRVHLEDEVICSRRERRLFEAGVIVHRQYDDAASRRAGA